MLDTHTSSRGQVFPAGEASPGKATGKHAPARLRAASQRDFGMHDPSTSATDRPESRQRRKSQEPLASQNILGRASPEQKTGLNNSVPSSPGSN